MSKQVISDEAVEAAARACAKDEDASNWDDEPEYYRNGWMGRMQTALEAAAPYMVELQWGVRDRESLLIAGHPTEESARETAAGNPEWYEVVKRPRPRFNPPWEVDK